MFIKKILITLSVMLSALGLVIVIGSYVFKRQISNEIFDLAKDAEKISTKTFTYEGRTDLPSPVQKYLKYALKEGQPSIQSVRLKQMGVFRTEPNQDWMPLEAEQYFVTEQPAFIWHATVKPFPFIWIEARDMYARSQGNMLVKLFSTVTIADAKGKEMDQSSLIRFLAEAVWYPTALLSNEYLQWEAIDSNAAKATIRDHGLEASGIFYFNEKGEITHFVSEDRYRTVGDKYVKEKWTGYYRNYQTINGVKIPADGEVEWNSESEDFSYAKLTITDIQYNVPVRY